MRDRLVSATVLLTAVLLLTDATLRMFVDEISPRWYRRLRRALLWLVPVSLLTTWVAVLVTLWRWSLT